MYRKRLIFLWWWSTLFSPLHQSRPCDGSVAVPSRWGSQGDRCQWQQRGRHGGNGGGVAIVLVAQAHLGRGVLPDADHAEATGPVDAGRTGTAAFRQPPGGHVHAPRGQAGRTVEDVRPALPVVGVRPERTAVHAPVLVAHQPAALVLRVQNRPVAAASHRGGRHQKRQSGASEKKRQLHLVVVGLAVA